VHAWLYAGARTIEEIWTRVEKYEQQRALTTSVSAARKATVVDPVAAKGEVKCWYCFKTGHVSRACPTKATDREHGIHRADVHTTTSAKGRGRGGDGHFRRAGRGDRGARRDRNTRSTDDNDSSGGGGSAPRREPAHLASFGEDFFTEGGVDADDESPTTTAGFSATLTAIPTRTPVDVDAWTIVPAKSRRGATIVKSASIATLLVSTSTDDWVPVTPPTSDEEEEVATSHLLPADMIMPGDAYPYDGTVDYGFTESESEFETEAETETKPEPSEYGPPETEQTQTTAALTAVIFGHIGHVTTHTSTEHEPPGFVVDSGCSCSLVPSADLLTDVRPLAAGRYAIQTAAGTLLPATGRGTLTFDTRTVDGAIYRVQIKNVLHVPDAAGTLISARQLTRATNSELVIGAGGTCLRFRFDVLRGVRTSAVATVSLVTVNGLDYIVPDQLFTAVAAEPPPLPPSRRLRTRREAEPLPRPTEPLPPPTEPLPPPTAAVRDAVRDRPERLAARPYASPASGGCWANLRNSHSRVPSVTLRGGIDPRFGSRPIRRAIYDGRPVAPY
jgi:hypothetical protein